LFFFLLNCTTMKSVSKLSVLAQPFGVGDAIKSWFGLFNLFLEANQIVIAENLHALTFSDIATSRKLLKRQLQQITSSCSTILFSGREVNNLSLAAGLADARRVDLLKVIQSPVSLTKQGRRCDYRCKRYARIKSPPFKCAPPAVEPRYIYSPSSVFTDGKFASSDSENSFLLLEFPDLNSDSDGDSDIDSVSNPEKVGVMK